MMDVFFSTNLSVWQVSNDAYWAECNLLKNHSRNFKIEKVRRANVILKSQGKYDFRRWLRVYT